MSTAAENTGNARKSSLSAVVGNTARMLSANNLPGRPGAGAKRDRTPLSVVADAPARRKVPFAVFCLLALVGALATVLVLNISVSSGQYELVKLKSDQSSLNKVNQDLTQQLQNAQAPQNLTNKARELGMVSAASTGQINVDTGTVAGNPSPAAAVDKPLPIIAAPALPGTPTKTATSSNATGQPAGAANSQPTGAAPPAAAAAPAVDLRGGSIPSPQQKTP